MTSYYIVRQSLKTLHIVMLWFLRKA